MGNFPAYTVDLSSYYLKGHICRSVIFEIFHPPANRGMILLDILTKPPCIIWGMTLKKKSKWVESATHLDFFSFKKGLEWDITFKYSPIFEGKLLAGVDPCHLPDTKEAFFYHKSPGKRKQRKEEGAENQVLVQVSVYHNLDLKPCKAEGTKGARFYSSYQVCKPSWMP